VKNHVLFALLLQLLASSGAQADSGHRCAADAIQRAKALLVFHAGTEADVGVEDSFKLLAPLRNPVNRQQFFDVLQVQGHVYRASFQMRLLYARVPGTCVLVGQEIIERSSL